MLLNTRKFSSKLPKISVEKPVIKTLNDISPVRKTWEFKNLILVMLRIFWVNENCACIIGLLENHAGTRSLTFQLLN